MIRVGIIGGAGYTAGELCRILLNHPEAEIKFINSSSNAGNKITDVHEGLYGETDLVFTDQLPFDEVDVLPWAAHGLLCGDVSVNAITVSTGAGVKPGATTHFSWRNNNMSIYKAFNHQHVPEICQSLRALQSDFDGAIDFIPYRGDFARGIFATEVVRVDASVDAGYFAGLYKEYYKDAAFTHYVDKAIDMKQVVNTNKALVHLDKFGDKLLVTATIDNLLKGASGQAVQNMNLMFGLDETSGLRLKPSAF